MLAPAGLKDYHNTAANLLRNGWKRRSCRRGRGWKLKGRLAFEQCKDNEHQIKMMPSDDDRDKTKILETLPVDSLLRHINILLFHITMLSSTFLHFFSRNKM